MEPSAHVAARYWMKACTAHRSSGIMDHDCASSTGGARGRTTGPAHPFLSWRHKSQNHTHLHTHTGTEHRGKRGSDRTQTTHTPEPSPRQPKHRPARADPGGPRRRPRSVTPLTPAARGRLSPGPPPPNHRSRWRGRWLRPHHSRTP